MVSQVYDRIADSYDDDWCGLYAETSGRAVAQIAAELAGHRALQVVDLAVGTGNTLTSLSGRMDVHAATGFDVSSGMLRIAEDKLGGRANLIHASAERAEHHLARASQDLVLCHFLLRYLDPQVVLPVAHRLLKPGGLFSLATTTKRSLIETYTGRFDRAGRLLRVPRKVAQGGNPNDHAQSMAMLRDYGFEVVSDTLYRQVVTFHSYDDVRAWALESGWAAEVMDGTVVPRAAVTRIVFALAEVFLHPLYPVDATNEISVVLARRPLDQ